MVFQNGKRSACFPSRQHTRINFPPDSKDRAVNSMEIFDFHKKDSPVCFKAWQSGYHFVITSTEFWAMKRILSLHSRTGNVLHAFINQLSHSCPLQEEKIPLPPLTSHLQPVFYYPYSLLLLLVNRELENSVSMVMWAW